MTDARRRHSAWLLLLAFVADGLLAPSGHPVQHAHHAGAQQSAQEARCADHRHDASSVEAPVSVVVDLTCPPCHSLSYGVAVPALAAAMSFVRTEAVAYTSAHLAGVARTHWSIRGPPAVA